MVGVTRTPLTALLFPFRLLPRLCTVVGEEAAWSHSFLLDSLLLFPVVLHGDFTATAAEEEDNPEEDPREGVEAVEGVPRLTARARIRATRAAAAATRLGSGCTPRSRRLRFFPTLVDEVVVALVLLGLLVVVVGEGRCRANNTPRRGDGLPRTRFLDTEIEERLVRWFPPLPPPAVGEERLLPLPLMEDGLARPVLPVEDFVP